MFEFLTKKNNLPEKAPDIEVAAEKPVTPEYVPGQAKKIGEFILQERMLKGQYDKNLWILQQSGIKKLFEELSTQYQLIKPADKNENNNHINNISTNTNPADYYLYYSIWKDHRKVNKDLPQYIAFQFDQEKINDYTAIYREIRAEVNESQLSLIHGPAGEITTSLDYNQPDQIKQIILESLKNPIIRERPLQFAQEK